MSAGSWSQRKPRSPSLAFSWVHGMEESQVRRCGTVLEADPTIFLSDSCSPDCSKRSNEPKAQALSPLLLAAVLQRLAGEGATEEGRDGGGGRGTEGRADGKNRKLRAATAHLPAVLHTLNEGADPRGRVWKRSTGGSWFCDSVVRLGQEADCSGCFPPAKLSQ